MCSGCWGSKAGSAAATATVRITLASAPLDNHRARLTLAVEGLIHSSLIIPGYLKHHKTHAPGYLLAHPTAHPSSAHVPQRTRTSTRTPP